LVSVFSPSPVAKAFSAARAATSAAVSAMATYQDGPSFKTDTVGAIQVTNAQLEVQRLFREADAAQSAGGLVNVTLSVTEALGGLLEDMKGLADSLRDQSITPAHRAILTTEFANLNARFDEMTAAATFAGLNLINPDATDQAGPVILPSGQQIAAHDLRKGQGTIMPIEPPVGTPSPESLVAAFAFEGNNQPAPLGTPTLITNQPSGYPLLYSDGESGGKSAIIWGYNLRTPDTKEITVGISFKTPQNRDIFRFATGSDIVSLSSSGANIVVRHNGNIMASTNFDSSLWQRANIVVASDGAASIYMNGSIFGNFSLDSPMSNISNNNMNIFQGRVVLNDNWTIYSKAFSSDGIRELDILAKQGVQNWKNDTSGSWSQVADDLSQSLANLRNVEAYYGGVARSLDRFVSSQQRLVDAIEVGVKRLVVPDLGKMAARRAAADVHAQVVLATMDTQRGIMNHPVNLLSGAMDAFDRMMVGRFTPSRLGI